MLSREDIEKLLNDWNQAWARHDIDGVMQLFHEDVIFENWTGARARGKQRLLTAWAPWFKNHGGFKFTEEETFIDAQQQKALYRWRLDWPSQESGFEGKAETRRGVDVIHFKGDKIIQKLTYSKTTVEIEGQRIHLSVRV
jgi:ketosteroid isomerase-like protein